MTDLIKLQSITQALLGQQNRLLKLTTPLGEDFLLPQRVIAVERLARGYDYTIDVVSLHKDFELKKLIAQSVTLWVQQPDQNYLPINGYVHTIKRLGSDGQLTYCQLSFAPWLHFLKFRKDARIWQEKKVDDILVDVFSAHPQARGNFRFELRNPVSQRSYCTQYETDWNFVQRLMEEEGWYSYHEQLADGSRHRLVITDNVYYFNRLNAQKLHFHRAGIEDEVQKIIHWSANRILAARQFTIISENYKAPGASKQSTTSVLPEHGTLPSQLEIYEYTGAYTYSTQAQGDRKTRTQVEEWESSMKRFYGVSGVRSLPVGHWFTFEEHPVHQYETIDEREFAIIAVEWCIENNLPLSNNFQEIPGTLKSQVEAFKTLIGRNDNQEQTKPGEKPGTIRTGHCFNRFEVQRRKVPYRSPAEHARPVIHPQTAVVVGPEGEEIYTDYLNRVKVRFRWDRQDQTKEIASCWIRVSYGNAGAGWGEVYVPRVGQEVIVTFLGGNPDRPVITGRLYNEAQVPGWHTNGRLSGYKSKEYKGKGFNQLVFDDSTNQNRIHLYSTNTNAQLNLGYLVNQRGNERSRFYGSGFSLSTDGFGAIVTHKGLFFSTFGRAGAEGTQLDTATTISPLTAGVALTKTMSDVASKAGAEPLHGQDALVRFVDATKNDYEDEGEKGANRFKEPILLAGSSAGIGLASVDGTHIHAGDEITLSSGQNTNIAAGKSLLASVSEKISLFAASAGIKLFAGKGKVEVQAQGDDLDLIAEKVVRLLSTTARVEIHAKEEVLISAGGSFIRINASGITNGTPGKWIAHASMHNMAGPSANSHVMPHLAKSNLQKTDLEFRHLTDWGMPLAGATYKATLSDGSIRQGTLDALGIARITNVPAGVAAKVEYDYRPLKVSSTVSTEIHDDIHELLNWTPGNADKGDL